jgi:hypothetical protein
LVAYKGEIIMANNRMSMDEALKPIEMKCATCGSVMTVYPDEQQGKVYLVLATLA